MTAGVVNSQSASTTVRVAKTMLFRLPLRFAISM